EGAVGAQHAAPLRVLSPRRPSVGYLSLVTAPSPPTQRPALPGLRLPLGRRRLGTGAVVSLVVHGLIIVVVLVRGRDLLQRLPGAPGQGGGGSEGAGRAAAPEPPRGLERQAKAVTFSSPPRERRFCRRWRGFPAPWPVAPTS